MVFLNRSLPKPATASARTIIRILFRSSFFIFVSSANKETSAANIGTTVKNSALSRARITAKTTAIANVCQLAPIRNAEQRNHIVENANEKYFNAV